MRSTKSKKKSKYVLYFRLSTFHFYVSLAQSQHSLSFLKQYELVEFLAFLMCCSKKMSKKLSSTTVVIHIMEGIAQLNKEKPQSIITFRHEGQSVCKISRTIKSYDETGSHEECHRKEDQELHLLQRISSLQLPALEITN